MTAITENKPGGTAIVTGAGGFLGSRLVRALIDRRVFVIAVCPENRDEPTIPYKSELLKYISCGRDEAHELASCINDCAIDVFYNLAWSGASGAGRVDYSAQLRSVKTCLDYFVSAEKLNCKKFIGVGSMSQRLAESSAYKDMTSENMIYAVSKSYCEQLLRAVSNKSNCKTVWAILSNLYGPGDTTPNLINYSIKTLLSGRQPQYGPATQIYDFMYIDDCMEALYRIGFLDTTAETFFIGSGQPRILKDYLNELGFIVAPDIKMGIGKRPDDHTEYRPEWLDTTALQKETGFRPQYSFTDGIKNTLEWIQEQQ
jgi:nucleoside-diphosphate-sugar epimerase